MRAVVHWISRLLTCVCVRFAKSLKDKAGSKLSRLQADWWALIGRCFRKPAGFSAGRFFFAKEFISSMYEFVLWAVAGYNSSSRAYPGRDNRVGARKCPSLYVRLVYDTFRPYRQSTQTFSPFV